MESSNTNTVIVYAWLAGQYVPAGKLRMSGRLAEFWYGEHYLQKGYALDPLRLPLTRQIFTADGLQGDLAALGDALPDGWGRYLLKRKYQQALSDLQVLTLDASQQRMGALFFSNSLDNAPVNEGHDLKWMIQFSEWVNDNSKDFPDRMEYGSSAGGAKPKCLVYTDQQEWIAKFQPANEPFDVPAIEHGTLELARSCGIPVAQSRLIDLPDKKHVLLVKRFDRDEKQAIHYLSGRTLCGVLVNDAEQVINDTRSYLVLADTLSRISSRPQDDRRDLFKRIVFNILVNNHDDHVKNHGVIRTPDGQWQLSPAFDLVAGEGRSRELAMAIGPEGNKASLKNLLQGRESFGLAKHEAINEINDMVASIQNWKNKFEVSGVGKETINTISWAIQDTIDVSGL